jgi:hypothetical protein
MLTFGVSTTPLGTRWPLVGRSEELELLRAAFRESAAGVVVAGEAGGGKTRLEREALALASAQGPDTEWVQATVAGATSEAPTGAM